MAHRLPYEPCYLVPPPPECGYSANDRNGINRLFVSGLSDDARAREIHNLFPRRPGFEFRQRKYTGRGNQVVAFATFVNHQSAMAGRGICDLCESSISNGSSAFSEREILFEFCFCRLLLVPH